MDLKDAISFHQLTAAAAGLARATQRQYLHFELVFLRYLDEQGIAPTLEALNETNVRSALLWYRQLPHPNASRNGEIGGQILVDILHLFARFLEREGVFADDPLRKLRAVKVGKRLRQPFTQAEVIGLWGACRGSQQPIRDETLFLLLLDTGMRIGEACGLTLDRVHLEQRLVVVGEDAKGKRQRLVPIGATDNATEAARCAPYAATWASAMPTAVPRGVCFWGVTGIRSRRRAAHKPSSAWARSPTSRMRARTGCGTPSRAGTSCSTQATSSACDE